MKKLLIILILLLLLTSCSSTSSSNNDSSNEEVDINENTTDVSNNDINTAFGYSNPTSYHYIVSTGGYYEEDRIKLSISDPYSVERSGGHPIGQKLECVDYDNAIAHSNLWVIYHE